MFEKPYLRLADVMSGWDNRLRAQLTLLWMPRGVAIGLSVALVVSLAARLLPLFERPMLLLIGGGAAGAGLLVAVVVVWVSPRRPLWMARRFDRAFGLRERMSTAVELAEGSLPVQSRTLARLQINEALDAAQRVDARAGLPLRFVPRDLGLLAVALAALLAAVLLPNPQSRVLAERRAVQEAISEELERLEAVREEVDQDPALNEAQRQEIVETLDTAIESLERPGLSREEAVAELSAAEDRLREIAQQALEQAGLQAQALQSAGQNFGTPNVSDELGEALSSGDYQLASELLASMLDQDNEPLSPEELQALEQELAEAASALEASNPELAEQLREASEALSQSDQAAAAQALNQASQQLSQSGQQAGQSQASGQAAQQVAGQLEQGQQSVAQAGQQDGQGGQPGPGQGQGQQPGNQPGGQPGQAAGSQGQSLSGSGAGEGAGLGEAQGGPISGSVPTNNSPGRDEERDFEPVFAPQNIGGEGGTQVDVPIGDSPGEVPISEGDFTENPAGQAQVPYSEVYGDYADAANQALESERVPLGLRNLVRDYFSSLDPGR